MQIKSRGGPVCWWPELPKLQWRRRRATPASNFRAAWRRWARVLRGSAAGYEGDIYRGVFVKQGARNRCETTRFPWLFRTNVPELVSRLKTHALEKKKTKQTRLLARWPRRDVHMRAWPGLGRPSALRAVSSACFFKCFLFFVSSLEFVLDI
jgi:hypothetical protein